MVAIQFQLSCDAYRGLRRKNILKRRFTMKRLTALVAAGIIASTAAQARAVDPDKPLKIPGTVTIVAFEQLEATALALHPGSTLLDTDLDEAYGKYLYQVELEDADGIEWEVELDALTGRVLKNHQDT
ncbi:Peptidase propeptide and YPEB domain-containing protein [Pseudomonas costantinii]|uniref:Peptidase propeptide and YPEB domain-containing protein n=2 Tax=Pseudomonas costantinii TaxID=168469 RepID=A0A1H5ITL4_9PSED|nr:Peptidase propeptide and YPEB domain-containing protein [Pseudomonas costantinii]